MLTKCFEWKQTKWPRQEWHILSQWRERDDEASGNEFESKSESEVSPGDEGNVSFLSKANKQSDFEVTLQSPNQAAENDIHDKPLDVNDNTPVLEPPRKISFTDQEDRWTLLDEHDSDAVMRTFNSEPAKEHWILSDNITVNTWLFSYLDIKRHLVRLINKKNFNDYVAPKT